MKIERYIQQVAIPIAQDNLVGQRLVDEPLFDFVEEQMMKVGSLAHGTVQWDEVEQATLKLLGEQSKDIKLLVYLLQCLHHRATASKLTASFAVMSTFIKLYWEDSYPAPGERGKNARGKFLKQMLQRFTSVVDQFEFNQLSATQSEQLKVALDNWLKVLVAKESELELVDAIAARVNGELQRAQITQVTQAQSPEAPSASNALTATETSESNLHLDHSSDKSTRHSLLSVADFLAQQTLGCELSIRLRRYAVWGAIYSPPDHKSTGETLLRGMQIERVKDYQEQLHQPSMQLWQQVEQSLTLAPFWFDGQLMSYQIAKGMGKESWCVAIAEETQTFLERMPALLNLTFKGGEPFVSEEVKQWLSETMQTRASAGVSAGNNWQEKQQETSQLAKEEGLSAALNMLNDGLQKASEKRDQFYWRLLIADLLRDHQLEAMAEQQYQTMHTQIISLSVPDWEPSLMEQILRHTK